MPISPLGNMNFVNQNVSYQSTQVSNEVAKEGFANVMNMAETAEKEKTAAKLERVGESLEVQEEIKEKSEEEKGKKQERQAKKKQDKDEEELLEDEEEPQKKDWIHRLDMSI
ncbi:MAG: hypothetical protein J1D99_01030 [Campylobacter sp.]|nr:hypothetical protein [Campylobacter sp.]